MKTVTTTKYLIAEFRTDANGPRWTDLDDHQNTIEKAKARLKRWREEYPRSRYGILRKVTTVYVFVDVNEEI